MGGRTSGRPTVRTGRIAENQPPIRTAVGLSVGHGVDVDVRLALPQHDEGPGVQLEAADTSYPVMSST